MSFGAAISAELIHRILHAGLTPRGYTVQVSSGVIRICEESNRDLLGQIVILQQTSEMTILQIRWKKNVSLHAYDVTYAQLSPTDCKLTVQLGVPLSDAVTNIDLASAFLSQNFQGTNLFELVKELINTICRRIESVQTRAQNQHEVSSYYQSSSPVDQLDPD